MGELPNEPIPGHSLITSHHVGLSSGLITIMVITLLIKLFNETMATFIWKRFFKLCQLRRPLSPVLSQSSLFRIVFLVEFRIPHQSDGEDETDKCVLAFSASQQLKIISAVAGCDGKNHKA